jgi:hypothetical protein
MVSKRTTNKMKDIINHIKFSRLSPVQRLIYEQWYGCETYILPDEPNSIFYMIGDKLLFEYCSKLKDSLYSCSQYRSSQLFYISTTNIYIMILRLNILLPRGIYIVMN